MKCLYCGSTLSKVVDKRSVIGTAEIRRRRECLKCHRRFTTYERVSGTELLVIKRDGHKEHFDREKLRRGLEKALEKRPAYDQLESILGRVEGKIRRKFEHEVTSRFIGQSMLTELKKIDPIAYMRFVSVYRQFNLVSDFNKELETFKTLIK